MTNQKGSIQIVIVLLLLGVIAAGSYLFFSAHPNVLDPPHLISQSISSTPQAKVAFPASPKDVQDVKNPSDMNTLNSALDSADLNKIDTELDATAKDSASF